MHGIIATSPTVPADEYTLAHRIVIRDMGDQYVVHMQVFGRGRGRLVQSHGNYFPKRKAARVTTRPTRKPYVSAYEKFERTITSNPGLRAQGVSHAHGRIPRRVRQRGHDRHDA